ncbi:hypothetical protein C0995_002520 [Termitomyces sp. Mi166|nr:hypothetical protein C0995_002520 [Termitomyces sp. Mi166\
MGGVIDLKANLNVMVSINDISRINIDVKAHVSVGVTSTSFTDQASGLWHTILDDSTSYLKALASAGFTYRMLKALHLRLIPKEECYIIAANKAIQSVLDNISRKGELKQVSFGTLVFDNVEE